MTHDDHPHDDHPHDDEGRLNVACRFWFNGNWGCVDGHVHIEAPPRAVWAQAQLWPARGRSVHYISPKAYSRLDDGRFSFYFGGILIGELIRDSSRPELVLDASFYDAGGIGSARGIALPNWWIDSPALPPVIDVGGAAELVGEPDADDAVRILMGCRVVGEYPYVLYVVYDSGGNSLSTLVHSNPDRPAVLLCKLDPQGYSIEGAAWNPIGKVAGPVRRVDGIKAVAVSDNGDESLETE